LSRPRNNRPLWKIKKKVIANAPHSLRAPEKRSLTLRLLGGLLLGITTAYYGPATRHGHKRGSEGAGLYPELAVLGIHEGVSPALAGKVARLTALLPSYQVAQKELAHQGLLLNIKMVHGIATQLGAEVLTARRRDLADYRLGNLPPGVELIGKRVGAAIDGGRVRIRTVIRKQKGRGQKTKQRRKFRIEWREPKVLIIFEMDEQGRMKHKSRPWIDGTFAGPDEAMELLAMHLHRLGAAKASVVTFLADGAPWIWERLEWVQKRVGLRDEQTVLVLDFCHAVHHISLALEGLGLDGNERQGIYKELRKMLRAGKVLQVVKVLQTHAAGLPQDGPVWVAIRYLEKHGEDGHMAYRGLRARGLPMGSGAIESAIRRVVNLRLKGNGLLWYEENAEAMLVLRAAALTDRWQELLEHVRERMASDRRLAWEWQSPDMPAQLKAGMEIKPPFPQPQGEQQPKAAA
jgi:hypothetical protein